MSLIPNGVTELHESVLLRGTLSSRVGLLARLRHERKVIKRDLAEVALKKQLGFVTAPRFTLEPAEFGTVLKARVWCVPLQGVTPR